MILNYLARMLEPALWVVPAFILVRLLWHYCYQRPRKIKVNWCHEIGFALFLVFLFGLASITISTQWSNYLQPELRGAINIMPMATVGPMFKDMLDGDGFSVINVVGNALMFAPIGLLISLLWHKKHPLLSATLWTMLASCFIEFTQLFSFRGTDIDDVILNTLGGLLGGLIYLLCKKLWPKLVARFKMQPSVDDQPIAAQAE